MLLDGRDHADAHVQPRAQSICCIMTVKNCDEPNAADDPSGTINICLITIGLYDRLAEIFRDCLYRGFGVFNILHVY